MIDVFINTEFKNEERHVRRLNKISNYENGTYVYKVLIYTLSVLVSTFAVSA